MHFCENCGNMYYIELNQTDTDTLIYYCRNCGNKNDKLIDELNNLCVSKSHIIKKTGQYKNVINEYTHLDPTLPRVKFNMDCPNGECDSNKKSNPESKDPDDQEPVKPREIIYLRYNDANMKYVYLCCVCKTHWKTDK
jgi:DNA-directed RNA polymerase subunit M/transcription elongation factor TFIIS